MSVINMLYKIIEDHNRYLNGEQGLLKSYVLGDGIKLELYKQTNIVRYKAIRDNKVISIITLDGIKRSKEELRLEIMSVFKTLFPVKDDSNNFSRIIKYKLHEK